MIPVPELSPEDIHRICTQAQETLKRTDLVCTSTSVAEIINHQTELETCATGVEQVINVIEREVNRLKNSLDALDSLKRDIGRHDKRSNRTYWLLRNSQPKV